MNRVDVYDPKGLNLREGVVVELADDDFLRIGSIIQSTRSGNVFLRGHTFRRTRHMNGMLDKKLNEVVWLQEVDEDDQRPPEVQSIETVAITQVVKRRKIRFTNQNFPALSFSNDRGWVIPDKDDPEKQKMYDDIENNAPLVCRIKYVSFFKDTAARLRRNRSQGNAVIFLRQNECDAGLDNEIGDLQLRYMWRGETELGGAQVGWEPGEKEFLRQEARSHAGKECNNSLVIAGRHYGAGDVMERGTVSDILIRDDENGVIYTKLSGVNAKCFVRSTLNALTGEESRDTGGNNEELNKKMGEALRGSMDNEGAFYVNDAHRRPHDEPSCVLTKEVVTIDSHWKGTTPGIAYKQRIESKITTETSVRALKSYKRNASDAFPLEDDSGNSEAAELPKRKESKGTINLNRPLPLSLNSHTPSHRISRSPALPLSKMIHQSPLPPTALNLPPTPSNPPHRRYTFGDCFCGAGGMSRAATTAGLRVSWGFDFESLACYSYALNFHTARVYLEDAHTFATSPLSQKVDICHMSPPCQFFSPAHTHTGKNDEVNTAAFLAVGMLLSKSRCRIAILEQTAGLLHARHAEYFHACVREFTHRGFSVRWKVLNAADYGLPQRRSRLFMIAAW